MFAKDNDNAYKIYLPSEYSVSTTFNMSDLSPFDVDDDSWMNFLRKEGIMGTTKLGIQTMRLGYKDWLKGHSQRSTLKRLS